MKTVDQGVPLDADSCDDLDCESQGCTGACERFTEAELIAADLEYDRNKAAKAHQMQRGIDHIARRDRQWTDVMDGFAGTVYRSAP